MTEGPESIVQQDLRRFDERQARFEDGMQDLKAHLRSVEGGEGLSGTGPKAGGPRYLYRFASERSLSINTAAQGGNAALMALDEE